MADLNRTVSIIFAGEDRASQAAAQVERRLEGIGQEAGTAGSKVNALDREVQQLAANDRRLDGLTEGLKALAASLVVQQFVSANVAVDQFLRTLTLVTGSSAAAAEELEFVRRTADALGLSVRDTAGAYASLAAATNGTNLQGQQTREIFEAVSRAMGALGRSSEETEGAFLAITQIVSKGRVSLEELSGQLGERLPGTLQIAARGLGLTTQELIKLVESGELTAEQFLPSFARALNETFAGATFDSYTASLNRLRNAIDQAFTDLGQAGAFEALTRGINAVTATITGAISTITLFGETLGNIAFTAASGDFAGFGARFEQSLQKAANSTRSLVDALTGARTGAQDVGAAGADAGGLLVGAFDRSSLSAKDLDRATREVAQNLRALGIDPKTLVDPIQEVERAFTSLANNPAATGSQIVTGLIGALQSLPREANLDQLRRDIAFAFRDGRISADELGQSLALLEARSSGLSPSFGAASASATNNAKANEAAAKAAERAADKQQELRIELEKLASNERIKNIEARVSIRTAELEAQTRQVQSAFESINATINSTGQSLDGLFKLFSNDNLSFRALREIDKQIEVENKRRDDALKLQRELVTAQIEGLRAQTRSLERGDSLIKIDGAGLQPHLEAFMWEILRTIQVRVNRDGLALLLGT